MPVVNIRDKVPYDVYVGRDTGKTHYGNPFSHMYGSMAAVIVGSRQESIEAFEKWLRGQAHRNVEQERRRWILEHLSCLRGKTVGCFCAPAACHGTSLLKLAETACSLSELKNGQKGTVLLVSGDDGLAQKLQEIGLIEGCEVQMVRAGDPLCVSFIGSSGKETHRSLAGGRNCQHPPFSNLFPLFSKEPLLFS